MTIRTIAAFLILGIIWGSNFIFMKWAADWITPLQVVLLRVIFGFLPIALYAVLTKSLSFSHLKHVGHFFVMSILATSLYYFGFAKGSALLLSSVAGVLSGAIPIISFLTAMIFLREEKATGNQWLGILIGLAGVVLIASPSSDAVDQNTLLGTGYMLLGVVSVGASFVYAKRFLGPLNIPGSAAVTYQLALSTIGLLLITDLTGIDDIVKDTRALTGMVLGLGLLGTGVAFLLYYYLIKQVGALKASSATYIPPVVALFIGVFWINESLELMDYFAAILVFIGMVLVNKRKNIKAVLK